MAAALLGSNGRVADGAEKPGSADNSLVVTFTAATSFADVLYVGFSYDNTAAATPRVSTVIDSRGNLWQEIADSDASSATAAAAVRNSVWRCYVTVPHQIGDTLTVTLSASVVAKAGAVLGASGINSGLLGYMSLPGTTGSNISTPDSAGLSITGDIDIRILLSADDWTPAVIKTLMAKENGAGQRSWRFDIDTTGKPRLIPSADGTAQFTATSSVAPTISDGQKLWLRATWRASDGRVQFFTADGSILSPVAGDFTQLGTDKTAAAGSIFDSTAPVELGSRNAGASDNWAGKIYKAEIRNGLDGSLVASPNLIKAEGNDAQGNPWRLLGTATVYSAPGGITTGRGTAAPSALLVTPATSGDLVVGFIAMEDNAVSAGDSDTTQGNWSTATGAASSGAGATTNAAITFQAKIVSGTTQQSWVSGTSGDHSTIAFTELAAVPLTQNPTEAEGLVDATAMDLQKVVRHDISRTF